MRLVGCFLRDVDLPWEVSSTAPSETVLPSLLRSIVVASATKAGMCALAELKLKLAN